MVHGHMAGEGVGGGCGSVFVANNKCTKLSAIQKKTSMSERYFVAFWWHFIAVRNQSGVANPLPKIQYKHLHL